VTAVVRRAALLRALALLALLAVAAGLRCYRLDLQSLWLDELFSAVFSRSELGIREVLAVVAEDVHPPAYPLLLHGWLGVFGDTDRAARTLSVLFGVLGVAAMVGLGRAGFDPPTGWIAGLLTAVNAFHIAYSQEARGYTLLFLAAAASYGGFLAVAARPGWRSAAAYAVATAAAMQVHYYGLVMALGQLAAALVVLGAGREGRRRLAWLLGGCAAAGLSMLPWLQPLLRVAGLRESWAAPPRPGFLLEYFPEYFGGSLALGLAAAALLLALPLLLRGRRPPIAVGGDLSATRAAALLAAAAAVSLLAAYLRSIFVVPMLVPKLTIFALPVVLLLVALAVARLRWAPLRWTVLLGLLALSAAQLAAGGYYTVQRKEQWREAVRAVLDDPRFAPTRDLCVGQPAQGFQFYFDQLGSPVVLLDAEPEGLSTVVGGRVARPAVWLLVARDETAARPTRAFLRRHWRRSSRQSFIATSVERWEPLEGGPPERSDVGRTKAGPPTG
jgi:uncharacterized membrane protein